MSARRAPDGDEGAAEINSLFANLKIEYWPLPKLKHYPRNPRINDHAVDPMCANIREFGFRIPIIAKSDGLVVDGHLRLKAAERLGMRSVPVVLADGLTDAQIKAFRLAVNKSAEWAHWNPDFLRIELQDLQALNFNLEFTGFSLDEITALTADATVGLTDPDEAPEAPEEPVSQLGDMWLMGRHRLVCGDATDKGAVGKVLNGAKPHLMVTDPPYGVDYAPDWRKDAARKGLIGFSPGALGTVSNDDQADWGKAWRLFQGDVAYIWHADRPASIARASIEGAGFEIRCQIIWAKSSFAISRGHYNWQHEPCWYAVRKGKSGHWCGSNSATTLWDIAHVKNETNHSTQKPVECMKRPIENNSKAGQAVYDPFVGSGTTIIAGEMSGRTVHAIEISPAYVDCGVIRWQNFTGEKAVLESSGKTYEEMREVRELKAA